VKNLLNIPGVELRAVCDLVKTVARIQEWVVKARKKPEGLPERRTGFGRLCEAAGY
jgi:hypothetical protein